MPIIFPTDCLLTLAPPRHPVRSVPQVMGEAKDVLWVGYILVGGEIVIAIFFIVFIVVLSERLKVNNHFFSVDESVFFRSVDIFSAIRFLRSHYTYCSAFKTNRCLEFRYPRPSIARPA